MPTLTDYIDPARLQQLQDIFVLATRAQVRIYDADGRPLTDPSDLTVRSAGLAAAGGNPPFAALLSEARSAATDRKSPEMPIVLEGDLLGRITLERASQARWPAEQMEALAAALGLPLSKLRRALQQTPGIDIEGSRIALAMLALLGEVLTRLCSQESQLRARVEELATMYRLTALFTAQRDLQPVLDTVARTVVEVTGVHGCSIRLLNAETQELTIQAVANLSPEYLSKGAILLTASRLDSEAFARRDVVYVADERTDPRVLYPEEARKEGLVSALIAPLLYQGRPVGALHLYTHEPHEFDPFETALVKAIAAQAAAAIVNAQLYGETLAAEAMRRQMRLAGEVQRRMIPAAAPYVKGLDIATAYVPSLELSGDFYDFIELPKDNLGVAICDVMGKGVPASLLMASIRASLRAHVSNIYALSDVLRRVNRSLCDDTLISDFATLFYGVVNLSAMELTYANAGHEPPLLVRGGRITRLSAGGTVLGIDRDIRYNHQVVALAPGDALVLLTDGIIEAMNFEGEQFGRRRVEQAVLAAVGRDESANGIARHLLWEMRRFAGLQVRGDDVTLVAIRVL